jgi:hypothetical protein
VQHRNFLVPSLHQTMSLVDKHLENESHYLMHAQHSKHATAQHSVQLQCCSSSHRPRFSILDRASTMMKDAGVNRCRSFWWSMLYLTDFQDSTGREDLYRGSTGRQLAAWAKRLCRDRAPCSLPFRTPHL